MKTSRIVTFILGIVMIITGMYCLMNPVMTYMTLGYVVGVNMIIDSVGGIILWHERKKEGMSSGWELAGAIWHHPDRQYGYAADRRYDNCLSCSNLADRSRCDPNHGGASYPQSKKGSRCRDPWKTLVAYPYCGNPAHCLRSAQPVQSDRSHCCYRNQFWIEHYYCRGEYDCCCGLNKDKTK